MRIILCDDHDLVVLSLTKLFEQHGHEVVATVRRPTDLPALVDRHRPDLCVLEVVTQGDEPIGDAMQPRSPRAPRRPMSSCSPTLPWRHGEHRGARVGSLRGGLEGHRAATSSSPRSSGGSPRRRRPLKPKGAGRYFLTEREVEVLESLANGDSTERIGAPAQPEPGHGPLARAEPALQARRPQPGRRRGRRRALRPDRPVSRDWRRPAPPLHRLAGAWR